MRQKLLLGTAGLVVALGLLASLYVATSAGKPKNVTAEITAYTSTPPYKVTFQVDKPPADTVRCKLYAIDFNSDSVGEVDNIIVPPQPGRSVRLSVIVPTTKPPTQFQVEECDVVPAATPMP